ncbi:MAG: acyltransferase family protein [Oryzihumus sp.]
MTVSPARWPYLDNLRTLLVAGIIAGHGVLGYSGEFGWTYQGYRETSLAGLTQTVVLAVVGPFAVFLIALLFLISGLLTPGSLQRKGTGAYVRDRVLRLGVPWAVFALLVFPTLVHWLDRGIRHSRATWWQDMRRLVPTLDTGPLWFLPVLLLFSFGYAVWWRTAATSPRTRRGGAPTGRTVALLVAGVAGGGRSSSGCGWAWTPTRSPGCRCGSGPSARGCSPWARWPPVTGGWSRCRRGSAAARARPSSRESSSPSR